MQTGFYVGIDVGGTFTDITCINESTNEFLHLKTMTTGADPAQAVIATLASAGIKPAEIVFLNHGTTVGINTLLEHKGAKTGIIATKGFRDFIELRRGARTHVLDPLMDKPPSFVPRRQRFGIDERIASDGAIIKSLNAQGCSDSLITFLQEQKLESIAICLLNSYANNEHEQIIQTLIKKHFPQISLTLSSILVPEIGEYERTSTTTLNAYIQPTISTYLSKLSERIEKAGLKVPIHIMQSNGGAMTTSEASDRPIHILESGPAAGAIAAAQLATSCGSPNVITLDMGGTTTKSSVIENGAPLSTTEYELFKSNNRPGSGLPLRVPMIDIVEIGAGGGSIVRVDAMKQLHIGPQSAGSNPGPVCYGQGGNYPTITDANAALGRVHSLLGGSMPLDIDMAKRALSRDIGTALAISCEEAASGVLEIADAKTADVIREVTISRGRDPRDFDLIAFGGAGPLQAASVVRELDLRKAIIPLAPGNFSAIGLLSTNLMYDSVSTYIIRTSACSGTSLTKITSTFDQMKSELTGRLLDAGLKTTEILVEKMVDMRYVGQFHSLTVPLSSLDTQALDVENLIQNFHHEHQRLFTYMCPEDECEIVNLRVRVTGLLPHISFKSPIYKPKANRASQNGRTTRLVYFREVMKEVQTPVFIRETLDRDFNLQGPAIIEEHTSTTLVPPDFSVSIDDLGNLILKKA